MKFPLFDAHCDTLSTMLREGKSLAANNLCIDLRRAQTFAPYAQFFAMFGQMTGSGVEWDRDFPLWEDPDVCFRAQYDLFQEELAKNQDRLRHCSTAREAKTAAKEGKIAAFLSVEGAELLACDIERLIEAHRLGISLVTLTWNNPNALSGTNCQETDRGLSDLGRQFVRTCRELGVIVDVSHISEKGFWDAAALMEGAPFVASHSNAKALHPHSRNLTDRQFQAIAKAGGVAGINLFTVFLGDDEPDVDRVIEHIEHFLGLGGEKSISIGADLDGCETLPRGISGIEDLGKIPEKLLKKNYPEALVCDIMYHNLMRVVEDVCGI